MIFDRDQLRGGEAATPDITVVIPVKNEAKRIENCLAALRDQTLPPKEVLVVDGHSTDNTVDIARRWSARVLYEDYRTRAGACQVGVEAAEGTRVAFTDADCIPEPQWLERLAAGFRDGVSGVGGLIANEGDLFWQKAVDAALDTLIGSANSVQGRPFASPRYVSSISGCNSMYRRADLIAVGGFRTDLITTEDTELNHRMMRRGKLLYVPDAVVHHRHQRGLRDFARRMFQYGYGRGQSLLVGAPLLISLAAAVFLMMAFLWPLLAIGVLAAYIGIVVASSLRPARRLRDARLVGALPIVLVIEHFGYIAGFWTGLVKSRIARLAAPRGTQGEPE